MQKKLKEKLTAFITVSYPEILLELQEDYAFSTFLDDRIGQVMPMVLDQIAEGRPGYVIEELAMNAIINGFGPSRFDYIKEVLEMEFPQSYDGFVAAGVLTYEALNILEYCKAIFKQYGYSTGNERYRELRYAIVGTIYSYLNL